MIYFIMCFFLSFHLCMIIAKYKKKVQKESNVCSISFLFVQQKSIELLILCPILFSHFLQKIFISSVKLKWLYLIVRLLLSLYYLLLRHLA